jgi:D-alanyl-D-alanine carboxypeptidase
MKRNQQRRRATRLRPAALATAIVALGLPLAGCAGPAATQSAQTAGTGGSSTTAEPSVPRSTPDAATTSRSPTVSALGTPGRGPGSLPPLDERAETDGTVTVFDNSSPTVANLKPDLRKALRKAATAAAKDGVTFYVTSGWRSAAHQQELLNRAIAEYGSKAEALKWVATPQTSPHVRGEAVDIGQAAIAWLSEHGAAYDLCQIYRNEPWHYELRAGAAQDGCPAMYANPTDDPRMQK